MRNPLLAKPVATTHGHKLIVPKKNSISNPPKTSATIINKKIPPPQTHHRYHNHTTTNHIQPSDPNQPKTTTQTTTSSKPNHTKSQSTIYHNHKPLPQSQPLPPPSLPPSKTTKHNRYPLPHLTLT